MNVVAVLRSEETGEALNEACAGLNGTKVSVHVGNLVDVDPTAEALQASDVLLLDVDPRSTEEMDQLRKILSAHRSDRSIVATAPKATLQDVRQFMHMGVVDFVPQPITGIDLRTALDLASRSRTATADPSDRHGTVISFLKAGGGVGASTLAVQSACLLAARGKADKSRVCLIDLDVQFGTDALYLDLNNRISLVDVLDAPDRVDAELLRSCMGRHDSGLDLLAAPRDMIALDALPPESLEQCLKVAREEYGVVVLDLPEAWTPWSYKAIEGSDLLVLVTQLTVAGVRQARRQIDTMSAHGLESVPVKVALNRFEKGWNKSVDLKDAEKALGRKFDYYIANDYKTVSEALNQGVALSEIKRKSKVEVSIQKMMDDVTRTISGEEKRPEPKLLSGLRRS